MSSGHLHPGHVRYSHPVPYIYDNTLSWKWTEQGLFSIVCILWLSLKNFRILGEEALNFLLKSPRIKLASGMWEVFEKLHRLTGQDYTPNSEHTKGNYINVHLSLTQAGRHWKSFLCLTTTKKMVSTFSNFHVLLHRRKYFRIKLFSF